MGEEHQVRDDCKLRFSQMEVHCNESGFVREKVATHDEQIKTLQGVVTTLIVDIKEIKDKLLGRLPLWATLILGGLMSICTGLVVYLASH